ncbi:MAG: GNAT family N-acetyltransferase [Gemmatimonadetes bacterium]|nr:GNAT family N-acetyltransferase [Gemmatimonadota bacterium]
MKLWRPDHAVLGPRRPREKDLPTLNRLFSEAFTDRYRRDGLVGVRVPPLNPQIWHYALRDAGEGAMVWHDEDDNLVAFNVAHCSGLEGWMGPLAVRPDRQGLGLGKAVVGAAVDWLKEQRVTTIGLETMPRTVENIGFYSRLGFAPGYLTLTLTGEITANVKSLRSRFVRLSELAAGEQRDLLDRCRERLHRAAPGYDYTRELELTADLGIGDTVVIEAGEVRGFALWHSAPLADARPVEELRVLKLFADSGETFGRLLGVLEACAAKLRIRRVAVRCQTVYTAAYRELIDRGYRVRWTDLRMTLAEFPEQVATPGAVVFSNWEI